MRDDSYSPACFETVTRMQCKKQQHVESGEHQSCRRRRRCASCVVVVVVRRLWCQGEQEVNAASSSRGSPAVLKSQNCTNKWTHPILDWALLSYTPTPLRLLLNGSLVGSIDSDTHQRKVGWALTSSTNQEQPRACFCCCCCCFIFGSSFFHPLSTSTVFKPCCSAVF